MFFFTPSPLQSTRLISRVRPEDYLVSIICVVRLKLGINSRCVPLDPKKQPGLQETQFYDDGIGNSPSYGGDFIPYKPKTDFTVIGHAYAPAGQRRSFLTVTIGANEWRKSLDILGDHDLVRGNTVSFTTPKPFASMALRMENAFGGLSSSYNPWGKGYDPAPEKAGSTIPVCNIHPQGNRLVDWEANIEANAFGPMPADRLPRLRLRGTYDQAWLYKRNPLPPLDFDWIFHNTAPADQQFSPYWTGTETLFFEHVHPDYPKFSSQLPGIRLRILVRREISDENGYQIEEITPALDSVHVNTDTMTVDIAWRALARSVYRDAKDLTHCYIASENMEDGPHPRSFHIDAFLNQINPPAIPPAKSPDSASLPDEEKAADELEQMETLREAVANLPFQADFKDAVAKAQTSDEIKILIETESKRVMDILLKKNSGE